MSETDTHDAFKKAERRGYAKGYEAGKRRRPRSTGAESFKERKAAFWRQAYIAMLPTAMLVQGWSMGDEVAQTGAQRIELATHWATEALEQAISAGMVR